VSGNIRLEFRNETPDSLPPDMDSNYDSSWDLFQSDAGYRPASEEAFKRKHQEWAKRDWMTWLSEHLTFPFNVTRKEDEDDAYFEKGTAGAVFRLGHTMKAVELESDFFPLGIVVKVREQRKVGQVPLCDVDATPKSDKNYWPVREYVVWFANR
jgi:hypothetical protein